MTEYVDETPRRPRRSQWEAEAEADLGHHFVTILSIDRPAPRYFGDNRGMLPVWVEANADWRQAGRAFDLQQPALRAVRLLVMGVPSATHAARLKTALDDALYGCQVANESDELRHRFRNGADFATIDEWWLPLVQDALVSCEIAARDFEVFSRADHERRIADKVKRRIAEATSVVALRRGP